MMDEAVQKSKMVSLLETTLNTRDLGGYKTKYNSNTKFDSLIRSDAIKCANERDIEVLCQKSIFTVIDLRGEKDVLNAPNSLQHTGRFQYYNFPIEEGSSIPDSVEDVSPSYMRIAEAVNMGKVFRTLANASQGIIYHCSAGKDRTGVISAILLFLVGVSEDDIVRDYMITKECNAPRFALLHKNFPEINMEIVIPQEKYMREFLRMFREKFGTAEKYLLGLGLSREEIERLESKLV